jgi:hypothetical protein
MRCCEALDARPSWGNKNYLLINTLIYYIYKKIINYEEHMTNAL